MNRTSTTPSGPGKAGRTRNVGPALVIGTALEFFDFGLYASMAALVFGRVFFPAADPVVGTLAAVATFAAGFVARPLGGIVFGALSDRIGRRSVLIVSFVLMGGASGVIGLIPGYAAIGVAAPILLVSMRILQGLGAGAEMSAAITASYEYAGSSNQGRSGARPALGANIGLFAATAVVAVLAAFGDEFLISWGWRIPFIASFALVGFGLWLRRNMPETPDFERMKSRQGSGGGRMSMRLLLARHWRGLLVVGVITFGYNGSSYIFKTFSLSYLAEFRDVATSVGTFGVSLASACGIVTVLVVGRLCDRVDPGKVSLVGAVLIGALAYPFFLLLNTGQPVLICLALVMATGITIPIVYAASMPLMARQFPPEVRATGLGLGREFPGSISGGLAPLVALAMVNMSATHSSDGVAVLLVGGALLMAGGAFIARFNAGADGAGQQADPHTAGVADDAAPARPGPAG